MSRVRSKGSKIELALQKLLSSKGFNYKTNSSGYFGKPDIIMSRKKTVIFMDSCFWHGCKKHFRLPIKNRAYWARKIDNNVSRDRKVTNHYKKLGWNIIRIWEHNLKKDQRKAIGKIEKVLSRKI